MWNIFKKSLKDETGQGMTEYVMILALIVLVAIVAFEYLGNEMSDKINDTADELRDAGNG